LALAFSMPFGYNLSIIIVLWSICFFAFEDLKIGFSNVFKNKWSYVLIGFFVLHAVGYFFSENKTEALSNIERKLSFLGFPILVFCNRNLVPKVKQIILAFISGCIVALLLCLLRAVYLYIVEDINAFFYGDFNYFMHPSYFAMYLTFSQLVIILFGREWFSHWSNLDSKLASLSSLIVIGIFLCSSKLGLLAAALLLPGTLSVVLYNKGFKKGIIALVLGIIIAVPITYKLFPTPYNRLRTAFEVTTSNQEINRAETDGTAVRILIWQESVKLIKENFLFGVTPGDENDVLCKAYSSHQLTGALEKQLNTHNQFLQTFLGTGLIGFILLCMMTFGALITGFIQKNYLLVLFSILAILNFLVESMLQAQSGFMFFVFFLVLLLQTNLSSKLE
jgi:O-antigen ligase